MERPVTILLEAGNSDFKQESQVRILNEILANLHFRNFVQVIDHDIGKVPTITSSTHTEWQLLLSSDIVHSLVCHMNLRFSHTAVNLNSGIPPSL